MPILIKKTTSVTTEEYEPDVEDLEGLDSTDDDAEDDRDAAADEKGARYGNNRKR